MQTSRPIPSGALVTEAQRRCSAAAIQVSHLCHVERRHHVVTAPNCYRVDLSITPRLNSRMRFDRWHARRYEQPGRLFVVPPGETLDVWNDLGRESVVIAHLFLDALGEALHLNPGPEVNPLDRSLNVQSRAIEFLMLRLREEVCRPGFAADFMIEGLSLQLAVELHRHYRATAPVAGVGGNGGLAPWRLRRIEERLRAGDHAVTLDELARLCDLSVRQLSRGFRASTGTSIGQYAASLRIERAKAALATERSIKRVASIMGFSSTAAFCSAFRKATGLTPGEFRKLN